MHASRAREAKAARDAATKQALAPTLRSIQAARREAEAAAAAAGAPPAAPPHPASPAALAPAGGGGTHVVLQWVIPAGAAGGGARWGTVHLLGVEMQSLSRGGGGASGAGGRGRAASEGPPLVPFTRARSFSEGGGGAEGAASRGLQQLPIAVTAVLPPRVAHDFRRGPARVRLLLSVASCLRPGDGPLSLRLALPRPAGAPPPSAGGVPPPARGGGRAAGASSRRGNVKSGIHWCAKARARARRVRGEWL